MREVKCLSSAAAAVRPGRTGSQRCLERPRKTKGLKLRGWVAGAGSRADASGKISLEFCEKSDTDRT